uniref:GDNF family receptor alpha like n=1 Tax=Nothoprocta perdicaria TaxID=30464 RepID=A0A8C6YWR7_NOTPE
TSNKIFSAVHYNNRLFPHCAVGCNTIIQRLADKYPVLKNCVCTTDGLCSITTLFEKECGINKDVLKYGREYLTTPVYRHTANRTCLDVNKECVEDEVCNKQLSLYLKGCSVNKKCNMKECQAAIRFFYQNMPFEIAHTMAFCDCIQPDESCHRAKELLHGKPCAVTAVPTPSCLNVIHMCEENDWCRKKYKTFRSKCWRHVTKKCYDDEACLETLLKDDIPCSASPACQAAYVGTWGTVLRVGCSCHHSPASEQPLCELFQRLLHSKSCLKKYSGDLRPWLNIGLTSTSLNIYVVICEFCFWVFVFFFPLNAQPGCN